MNFVEPTNYEESLTNLVDDYVRSGLFTHCFAECGFLSQQEPILQYQDLPDGSGIFDLASLTKAIVTTPLIFNEVCTGNLDLKQTLGSWLGEKALGVLDPQLLALTPYALLKHQSGLPAWRNFYVNVVGAESHPNLDECLNRVSKEITTNHKTLYSDIGYMLLGRALELKHNKKLSYLFYDFCDKQLGFNAINQQMVYTPELIEKRQAIPTALCALRSKLIRGEVHDENCWALGGVCGHAGLFSSGRAFSQYLRAFFNSSVGSYFTDCSLHEIKSIHSDYALGYRTANFDNEIIFGDDTSLGHNGFTGTAFWVSLTDFRYSILFTNRTINKRVAPEITTFRKKAFKILDNAFNK